MKHRQEKMINTHRLVRSAMNDEDYCSFILDCLHKEQSEWSVKDLNKFWDDAAKSNDTVEEWINNHRGKWYVLCSPLQKQHWWYSYLATR